MAADLEEFFSRYLWVAAEVGIKLDIVERLSPHEEFATVAAGACVVGCSRMIAQRSIKPEEADFEIGYAILSLLPWWPKGVEDRSRMIRLRKQFLPEVASSEAARAEFQSMLQPLLLEYSYIDLKRLALIKPLSDFMSPPFDRPSISPRR